MIINKRLWPFILLVSGLSTLQAQQSIRLNNNWEFLRQDMGTVWEAVRPIPKEDAPEAVPVWQKVILPHCINAEDAVDPDVNYYQGPAWYRTRIAINNPYENGRTLLHFEGAGQKTEVYVYTTLVGSHIGGYDEFTIDITAAVDAFRKTDVFQKQFKGTIPVSIRTDNSRDPEMIPSSLSDFTINGGIYRYLDLVYQPEVSIDKVLLTPAIEAKSGRIISKIGLYDPGNIAASRISFQIRIIDPEGKEVEKKVTAVKDNISNISTVQLWSPSHPKLYTVEIDLLLDGKLINSKKEKTGFRQFEFTAKGPFLLNGKRLLLNGTHRHEDDAGVGAASTEEMMREEMLSVKQMGVNFIRLGHYQQSGIILNLCDSLGIIVWEEIPWCRGGLGGDKYQEQGQRMLTNMIEQHYNHPSIMIWGLGNENDWPGDFTSFDTLKIRAYMKELNVLSHKLDPSRKTAIRRCDFCKDIPDIYSPSIWAGWYRGIYTDYKMYSEMESQKVDHFLHVEWGGDAHAGRYAEKPDQLLSKIKFNDDQKLKDSLFKEAAKLSKDNNWNETYISNLVDWHLKEQETMPWLTGTAQWAFKDFSTPLRPTNPVPYVNQKGVVERDGTKKEAYYVFQSYWTTGLMAHIFGHSWPVRWGNEGEEKMIKVYSNCEQAELFVNGKSYGKKKRNSQDYPAAGLRWNIALTKGPYDVKVIASKGKEIIADSIHFEYQTEKWGKPAKAELRKIKEENGIVTVQVKLFDEKNVLCLDAANWVRFGLSGDGRLIDDLGTASGSRLVQLHNGVAVISIRTNGGHSVVSAAVETAPTIFINL